MKILPQAAAAILTLLCAPLLACKPWYLKDPKPVSVEAEVLWSGSQCSIQSTQPVIYWVGDAEQWQQWHAVPPRVIPLDGTGSSQISPPPVNFDTNAIVLVGLGRKPTGGYRIDLAARGVQLQNDVLEVYLQVTQPKPGDFVTQAQTSPCLAVQVPRQVVNEVHAIDQRGATLARAQVSFNTQP